MILSPSTFTVAVVTSPLLPVTLALPSFAELHPANTTPHNNTNAAHFFIISLPVHSISHQEKWNILFPFLNSNFTLILAGILLKDIPVYEWALGFYHCIAHMSISK